MSKVLHIYYYEERDLIETVEEVIRLMKAGFTSGIDPDWDIEELEG